MARITDNLPKRQLVPRQLAAHKTRPKTTRPTLIRQLTPQVKVVPPPSLLYQVPISLFNWVKPTKI